SKEVRYFYNDDENVLDVSGTDKIILFNSNMNQQNQPTRNFNIGEEHFVLSIDSFDNLHLKSSAGIDFVFDVKTLGSDLMKSRSLKEKDHQPGSYYLPSKDMTIQKEAGQYIFRCMFNQIHAGYGE